MLPERSNFTCAVLCRKIRMNQINSAKLINAKCGGKKKEKIKTFLKTKALSSVWQPGY